MSHLPSRTQLLLIFITALGAFFRFYNIDQLPPGFQFDQAFYVFDSLRLLQGNFRIFFDAPGGSEPFFLYAAMPGVALFGVSPLGLKLTSAVIGVIGIPLVYLLARSLFQSTRIGLLAAFFTAVSVWDYFYGRYGERITLLVLLVFPLFLFLWRAINNRKIRDYVFVGVFLGLALYTYLAARVLPLIVVLMTVYMALSDRRNARGYIKGLFVSGAVALAIFLPLAAYFVSHPGQFISHSADVSIFVPHGGETGNIAASLGYNTVRLLEMFVVRGDDALIRNVPNRPVFDPLTAVLFVAGVLAWLRTLLSRHSTQIKRRRAVLFLVWLIVGMAVSLVSDDAPNFSRLRPIIPAVMMLPAWGSVTLWDWAAPRVRSLRSVGPQKALVSLPYAAMGIVLIAGTVSSYQDYFVAFARDPALYYAFDVDKVEVAEWANARAPREQLFVAPLSLSIGTVSLLTRNAPLKTFESRDTIVLPSAVSGKDAVYSFPPEQERKAETMLARLGPLATREDLLGVNQALLMINLRVPAENLPTFDDPLSSLLRGGDFVRPQAVDRTSFSNQIELLGHTLNPEGPGGRNLTVSLLLRALKPLGTDYTFSLKVRDSVGRVWGQEDKWAGDNSFPTPQWGVGDVIIEKFYPGLSACAPSDKYDVSLEIYDPETMAVLSVDGAQDNSLYLGNFNAGSSEGNRYEDLEIEHPMDQNTVSGAPLIGYNLSPEDLRLGDKFSLSLFWRGTGQGATVPISASLGAQRLISQQAKLPPEGRGLCTLYDLTLPSSLKAGTYPLTVNGAKLSDVKINP